MLGTYRVRPGTCRGPLAPSRGYNKSVDALCKVHCSGFTREILTDTRGEGRAGQQGRPSEELPRSPARKGAASP